MKTLIKPATTLLFTAIMIFTSCIKEDDSFSPRTYTFPGAVQVVDILKGKEFRFDSLIWSYDDNTDNTYLLINNRPDLFTYPRDIVVSLMRDSASDWVSVRKSTTELPYYGFIFGIGNGRLTILPRPADISLEGKMASVQVRF